MDSTKKAIKTKVLKMYVADYKRLDDADKRQLKEILKHIYQTLKHQPERNFIFWGYIRPQVIPVLITNGFRPTTLNISDLQLNVPVIVW